MAEQHVIGGAGFPQSLLCYLFVASPVGKGSKEPIHILLLHGASPDGQPVFCPVDHTASQHFVAVSDMPG